MTEATDNANKSSGRSRSEKIKFRVLGGTLLLAVSAGIVPLVLNRADHVLPKALPNVSSAAPPHAQFSLQLQNTNSSAPQTLARAQAANTPPLNQQRVTTASSEQTAVVAAATTATASVTAPVAHRPVAPKSVPAVAEAAITSSRQPMAVARSTNSTLSTNNTMSRQPSQPSTRQSVAVQAAPPSSNLATHSAQQKQSASQPTTHATQQQASLGQAAAAQSAGGTSSSSATLSSSLASAASSTAQTTAASHIIKRNAAGVTHVLPGHAAASAPWWVQLGTFSQQVNAQSLEKRLQAAGYAVLIKQITRMQNRSLWQVFVTADSRQEALKIKQQLQLSYALSGLIKPAADVAS